uniref:ATP synthase F0 subunit 6 n=1 Tax=Sclomina guangxiensis TaxID=1524607 RepID=UPI002551ED74|nr:ATP synthase F0 subunit 6 [Sclomina guangxiensis]WGT89384.1 ATP synthase F0 subunit 6 [Sclomina guangxiensis]WGT89397.1 ATP synthase F0 subunit 6 [Sclomina guangxiensis]WGT89410.1 ATP synthase F0 subunit 6 [Sclomina guangxiensis]WGT89436.1 ATP synthase F0 subunit 6 [Sclomina guangxiensis]WGT89449.1 ATP synthase F0 subunit 6 [Sclomina guangxiensis]
MMSNVFSTFDPATSMSLSLNWTSTILVLFMIPSMYWLIPSRYNMIVKIMYSKLHTEFVMILGTSNQTFSIMFITLFVFILMNNMIGLLPYMFTSSSHLTFTLTLALPMWLAIMLFGWINHTQHMFAHLVPEGTPPLLMPFMVCIETISNLTRPVSLSVRLMANMVAGHLFMCMLGSYIMTTSYSIFPMTMMMEMFLMLYETAVALIQAYVFSMLSALYTKEVT